MNFIKIEFVFFIDSLFRTKVKCNRVVVGEFALDKYFWDVVNGRTYALKHRMKVESFRPINNLFFLPKGSKKKKFLTIRFVKKFIKLKK